MVKMMLSPEASVNMAVRCELEIMKSNNFSRNRYCVGNNPIKGLKVR